LFAVAMVMGGGHGTYIPAIAIFPFGMLVAMVLTGQITWVSVFLAIAQFPVYGFAASGGSRKASLILATIHVGAVALALLFRPGSNFE
jgi:hypothetical protein